MEANGLRTGRAIPTGMALAITVGIAYAARALAFRIWPETAVTFMNALFGWIVDRLRPVRRA